MIRPVHLESCPYCSARDVECFRPGELRYAVRCKSCRAQGPAYREKYEAVDSWNTVTLTLRRKTA